MKIVIVSGAFPPASLAEANHALHLAEALARSGADVHVLTTQGSVVDGLPFTVHALMRDWSWSDARSPARVSPGQSCGVPGHAGTCAADIAAPAPTLSLGGLLLALASLLSVGAAAVLRRRRSSSG